MVANLHEEEQGLFEILHPLILRWKWIAAGVFAGMMIAAVASFFLPKQYETTCLLNIGMAVEKSLEDPYTVTRIINSGSFQQTIATKVGLDASAMQLQKMIVAETDSTRLAPWVSISVMADDPQKALRLANATADGILERHGRFFDEKMRRYEDYQKDLELNFEKFNQEAVLLKKNLDTFRSNPHDVPTELILQSRLLDKENQISLFRRELRDNLTLMSAVHSRRTALVARPVLPKSPTKPNLKLNLIVAAVVSTFLMITIVLLWEQYRKGSLRV